MPGSMTEITLAKEVWIALITFVAAPLAASVAANLQLKGALQHLSDRVERLEQMLFTPRRTARIKRSRR